MQPRASATCCNGFGLLGGQLSAAAPSSPPGPDTRAALVAAQQICGAFSNLYPTTTSASTLFTRFYPDGNYQPFLPRFYPVFTSFWEGKMCRGKKEGKNGVKRPIFY